MKITKRQLRRIIKEMTISTDEAEAYLRDRAASYERDGLQGRGMKMLLQDDFLDDLGHQHNIEDYEWLIDELISDGPMGHRQGIGESKMRITKRQLRGIIKKEHTRLLREQEEVASANGDHHWPRVDWSNVGDLVDKWISLEYDAWDKADTSMNPDDVTDTEARKRWGDQVEGAGMDMEAELTLRVRRVALQTMKEFSEKLINGEYS